MIKNAVVIYSGGADSTVILHHCLKIYEKIYCLTFDYKQRHSVEIIKASNYIKTLRTKEDGSIADHRVIDLSFYGDLASTSALTNKKIDVPKMKDVIGDPQNKSYCPNRNMVLLSIAAAYAESVEARDVFYGATAVDDLSGYWDCTKPFLKLINDTLGLNRRNNIKINAPLIEMTKKEIIEYGVRLGVDFSNTYTCYNGEQKGCGVCPSCSARIKGFIDAKIIDPLEYKIEIDWKKYNCKPII
jgi:7-cyano-7-deazaguanine synthase